MSSDSSPVPSAAAPGLTDEQMVAALAGHLSGHRVVGTRGIGTASAAGGAARPLAELSIDDGKQHFVVTVDLRREPAVSEKELARAAVLCDQEGRKSVICTRVPRDGDALLTLRRPLVPVPGLSWSYALATPSGDRVTVTEWSSAAPVGAAGALPDPPLDLGRLREIVLDPVWIRALTGLPVAAPPEVQQPAAPLGG
ncbi:hypothetical protein [Kitasatospora sp. NPDC059571]|uniref:hypothetical protein n=1 Tax=Kitasatospora sp. NPDC059571 TaxID=3346871 RepID=UPI0036C3F3C2